MNSTVIDPVKLRKIKKLANEVESLKSVKGFVGLTQRQDIKLNLKTEKLLKIIKTL